ncbi:hypothetical protein, partial [Pseudomonas aeruginosa]|uniref:hypothetical protein n=1 Tax=Pseudomonas aeruginosa TaxID=287 RepID=UPI001E4EA00D
LSHGEDFRLNRCPGSVGHYNMPWAKKSQIHWKKPMIWSRKPESHSISQSFKMTKAAISAAMSSSARRM